MAGTDFNSEGYRCWLAVVEATRIAHKGIAPLIQRELENWYRKLLSSPSLKTMTPCNCKPCICNPGKVATCGSCVCCQVRKRNYCKECANIKMELERSYKSKLKSRLCWQNSTCKQWRNKPWEVAKVFLGRLGSRAGKVKDANSTDISGLLNLMEWCLFTFMPVSPAVLYDVREARNMWAHEAEMKFSEDEMNEAFTAIESLLKDPVFIKDEDAKKALKDLRELQDPTNRPQLLRKNECDLMKEVTRVLQCTVEKLEYNSTVLEHRNNMLEKATARYSNLVKKRKEEEENRKEREKKEMIERKERKKRQSASSIGDELEPVSRPIDVMELFIGAIVGAVLGGTLGTVVGGPFRAVLFGFIGSLVGGTVAAAARIGDELERVSRPTDVMGLFIGATVGAVVGGTLGAVVAGPFRAVLFGFIGSFVGGTVGTAARIGDENDRVSRPIEDFGLVIGVTVGAVVGGTLGAVVGGSYGAVFFGFIGSFVGGSAGKATPIGDELERESSLTDVFGGFIWATLVAAYLAPARTIVGGTVGAVVGGKLGAVVGGPFGAVLFGFIGSFFGGTVGTAAHIGDMTLREPGPFDILGVIVMAPIGAAAGTVIGGTAGSVVVGTLGAVVGGPFAAVLFGFIGSFVGGAVGIVVGVYVGAVAGLIIMRRRDNM